MRILLFANTDWFLYNFKLSLARALRDQGHEVVLVSPSGAFGEKLRELGFVWECFELSRSGVNPFSELSRVRALTRLYARLKPDLVHHFTIKCVIYGSFAARRAGVSRVVNSITGLGFALLASTVKARVIRPVVVGLYRRALRGSCVIFQNGDNRDTLQKLGVLSQSRVFVIPGDGVDSDFFCPPESEPATPVVLMVGRLLWSKGVADFVKAACLVREVLPQVQFWLAGEPDAGNPESIDEGTLSKWRESGEVVFLGQRSDMVALQQSCAVAVLASTQGEGMPRALLEAASCGRPLVATDVPGSRELVEHGVNGLLVPPSSAAKLAQAVVQILGDEALALRMRSASRACVLARFSDERITEQTVRVYVQG